MDDYVGGGILVVVGSLFCGGECLGIIEICLSSIV